MSQRLPYKDLITTTCVSWETMLETAVSAEMGYILEVELHYFLSLRYMSINYPFCPESKRSN